MKNYYELLDVDQNASTKEITKAYRKTALLIHPDRHQKHSEWATVAFKHLQHVYDTLINPELRAEYDKLIAKSTLEPKPDPKPAQPTSEPERYPFKEAIKDALIVGLILGLIGALITLLTP